MELCSRLEVMTWSPCSSVPFSAMLRENPAIRIFAGEELVEQVAGVVERAFGFHGHAVPGAAGVGHGITGEPVHGDIDRFGLWVRG